MSSERFIRWQRYTIEQLSFALNLFLGLSVGSPAFGITLVRDDSFSVSGCWKVAFSISLVALALSILAGCVAVVTRLLDFRYTARNVRSDETFEAEDEGGVYRYRYKVLGQFTWRLFWFELSTFAVGRIGLVAVLYSEHGHKLWWVGF